MKISKIKLEKTVKSIMTGQQKGRGYAIISFTDGTYLKLKAKTSYTCCGSHISIELKRDKRAKSLPEQAEGRE